MKQQRSGFSVMRRLIVLVRPLAPFMALAVLLGVAGFVCAIFLTILGGWAILEVLGLGAPLALGGLFACAACAKCCNIIRAKTAWQGWRSAQKACCTPRNA